MKVVYCSWGENSTTDMLRGLSDLACEVINPVYAVGDYLAGYVEKELQQSITEDVDAVISFDFFPVVSKVCNQKKIPYIAWVYDWPNYTLFEPEIYNACNRVYLFERQGIEMLSGYRVNHLRYSPLAVDEQYRNTLFDREIEQTDYLYDVSFVGNMYLDLKGAMMTSSVPPYYEGFVKGIAMAQSKIYGYNLVNEIVDQDFAAKYFRDINVQIKGTGVPAEYILATQVNRYITGEERKHLISKVAEQFDMHLFTQEKGLALGKAFIHGAVNYNTEMPKVFRSSKINLNITLRSITTGVPLRVFDILGSGGFCLTNYQEGILEHFVEGEDLVMFSSEEELLYKIQYYLNHEEERMKITRGGFEKVQKYNYRDSLRKMLEGN